ncbi:MAG TPA: lipid-binding protein [Prolixibacteraceae bacterium]|nr:lipid-binding protein [Prolixibacteraceae bacterium]
MKTLSAITLSVFLFFGAAQISVAQDFNVNTSQSAVKWNGKKVTGEHYGTIKLKSGSLKVANGQVTGGNFEMDMNSIVCEDLTNQDMNARLVGHLKSDDFFSVEKHGTSKFVLSNVKKVSGNEYEFTGNLTIKGITHPVTFEANTEVNGNQLKANGKITVDRTKYDIRFRSGKFFSDLGDNLIYDDFTLDFNLTAQASN